MGNTDHMNRMAVVHKPAAVSSPAPSEEIVRNLAAFRPKEVNDFVQVREDYHYYHVNIGWSKVDQIYQSLHDRMRGIKDKYNSSIRALLTQLLADQGTDNNVAVHATPSKARARKRPVPKSSSVNKVIISRSKRSSGDRSKNPTSAAYTSKGARILPLASSPGGRKAMFRGITLKGQTTDESISPGVIADDIDQLQNALDLMTELTIDPDTSAQKNEKKSASSKKPFIAAEESVMDQGIIIIEESTISNQTVATGMKTRSRTRQANNNTFVNNATKTITKARNKDDPVLTANLFMPTSASKISRTKVKGLVAASPKSLVKPNGGLKMSKRRSQSASNLNATPSKPNLVDLSALGLKKTGSLNKLTLTTSVASSFNRGSSHNLTPKRLPRRACAASPTLPSTSSSIGVATRRHEIESSFQKRLILSEDKRKKVEEKKKALLDSRTHALKKEREKRMEKIAENKKQIDHEKEIKFKAISHVEHSTVTLPPGPIAFMTNAELRVAERRLKLAQLELEQDAKKANKAAAASTSDGKGMATKAAAPTKTAKPVTYKSKTKDNGKKQQQQEVKPEVKVIQESMEVDFQPFQHHHLHLQDAVSVVMSPIAKTSDFNGKINETFTAAPNPSTTPRVSVPVVSSTFISASEPSCLAQPAGSNNETFAKLTAPPPVTPGKAVTNSFNLSKALLKCKLNETDNYEMTPPPRERCHINNYDISQYVDSEDEEKQAAHDAAQCGKQVPKWCQGKQFLKQIHEQFGMPADQLAEWTRRIFPRPALPVRLDVMGLKVREKYAQRSSSVNWKTAAEIEMKLKKSKMDEKDNGQKK